jgi:hypothetical protein
MKLTPVVKLDGGYDVFGCTISEARDRAFRVVARIGEEVLRPNGPHRLFTTPAVRPKLPMAGPRGLEPERCGSPFLFDRVKKLAADHPGQ